MNKADFIKTVLSQKYGKTEAEWRDDVIKPRLMVQAMCKDQLRLDDAELKKVFDNLYGEKVQCKVILWPKGDQKEVLRVYAAIRSDDKAFDDAARKQPYSDLQAKGGMVDPIGRNSGPGTAKIEEIAFRLKDGQVSEMIDTGNGLLVIKRIHSIPARTDVSFESQRVALTKELTDRQMDEAVPKMFAKLNEEARPLFILSPKDETRLEMEERSSAWAWTRRRWNRRSSRVGRAGSVSDRSEFTPVADAAGWPCGHGPSRPSTWLSSFWNPPAAPRSASRSPKSRPATVTSPREIEHVRRVRRRHLNLGRHHEPDLVVARLAGTG